MYVYWPDAFYCSRELSIKLANLFYRQIGRTVDVIVKGLRCWYIYSELTTVITLILDRFSH